jgi:hypothetical protein
MSKFFKVVNSRAITQRTNSLNRKILLRYNGLNIWEIYGSVHYREIRFNMLKPRAPKLLFEKTTQAEKFSGKVFVYGDAAKRLCRW